MSVLTRNGEDILGIDAEIITELNTHQTFITTNKSAASGGTDLTPVSTGKNILGMVELTL